jgi:hypothetical protein
VREKLVAFVAHGEDGQPHLDFARAVATISGDARARRQFAAEDSALVLSIAPLVEEIATLGPAGLATLILLLGPVAMQALRRP